ncbi:MAG: histidine phosphatase family protein [Steroidobacteraceae bacterium]|jgi:alpha-ribazole phosphatase
MDVFLIRHTKPENSAGLCYGRLDLGVGPDFAAAAERLPPHLPKQAPIVTTDAQRCMRLAAYLSVELGSPLRVDARLQELNFGQWEGRLWADIPRVQTDVWARDVWGLSPPGGETYAELFARLGAAWESLLQSQAESLMVVGTAGPLRALIAIALELPVDSSLRFHLDYGGFAKLSDSTGGWRLDFANR